MDQKARSSLECGYLPVYRTTIYQWPQWKWWSSLFYHVAWLPASTQLTRPWSCRLTSLSQHQDRPLQSNATVLADYPLTVTINTNTYRAMRISRDMPVSESLGTCSSRTTVALNETLIRDKTTTVSNTTILIIIIIVVVLIIIIMNN